MTLIIILNILFFIEIYRLKLFYYPSSKKIIIIQFFFEILFLKIFFEVFPQYYVIIFFYCFRILTLKIRIIFRNFFLFFLNFLKKKYVYCYNLLINSQIYYYIPSISSNKYIYLFTLIFFFFLIYYNFFFSFIFLLIFSDIDFKKYTHPLFENCLKQSCGYDILVFNSGKKKLFRFKISLIESTKIKQKFEVLTFNLDYVFEDKQNNEMYLKGFI